VNSSAAFKLTARLLERCGLAINGPAARDPQIHDERVYARLLKNGSVGAGEAFMDGWWDARDLSGCLEAVLRADLDAQFRGALFREKFRELRFQWLNRQTRELSRRVARDHYDLPFEFWRRMLGKTMQYSCAYWERGARDLDEAQVAKMELICRKLQLEEGLSVLETACGWGSLAHHMAAHHGVRVKAFTLSEQQYRYAVAHYSHPRVEFFCADYRDFAARHQGEKFDRIASIGLVEHVGRRNLDVFFRMIQRFMKPEGWALVHGMGKQTPEATDPWITRYIFPGGEIPRLSHLVDSISRCALNVEDLHNLGLSYIPTLRAWLQSLSEPAGEGAPQGRALRMWVYFLSLSIAAFEARKLQLYHFILSHHGAPRNAIPAAVTLAR
jgi:cyclopropane-fatty-acyl-phospholipid synthase